MTLISGHVEEIDPRYRRVCPVCNAAVGSQCLEPVRDGNKYRIEPHPERLYPQLTEEELWGE